MKQNINEIKKMQRLAGLITEDEYRESHLNESLPAGKTELGKKTALALNAIVGRMTFPNLESEARALSGQLINLIDKDQSEDKSEIKEGYLDNPSQTLNLSLNLPNYNRNQLENLADSLADLGQRKQENQVRLYIKDNF